MCLPAMPTRFATRTRASACSRHHTVQVRASPVCRSFAVCAHHPPCAECCATNTCKDNSWSCDVWCVRGAGRRLPLYVLAGHWPRGSMCSLHAAILACNAATAAPRTPTASHTACPRMAKPTRRKSGRLLSPGAAARLVKSVSTVLIVEPGASARVLSTTRVVTSFTGVEQVLWP